MATLRLVLHLAASALPWLLAACAQTPAAWPQYPGGPRSAPAARPVPPPAQRQAAPPFPSYPAYPSYPAESATVQPAALPRIPQSGAALHEVSATLPSSKSVSFRAVAFDSGRFRIAVIDQPDPNASPAIISRLMREAGAVAGTNGGFFSPDFKPVGLVIHGGRSQGEMASGSLVSGAIAQQGDRVRILWNAEISGTRGFSELLQTGPRLVNNGAPIQGLENQKSRARVFVATDGAGQFLLGTSGACTLAELASALARPGLFPGFTVQRALNLDGGRSTAFYANLPDRREISLPGWTAVRNYLAVLPR